MAQVLLPSVPDLLLGACLPMVIMVVAVWVVAPGRRPTSTMCRGSWWTTPNVSWLSGVTPCVVAVWVVAPGRRPTSTTSTRAMVIMVIVYGRGQAAHLQVRLLPSTELFRVYVWARLSGAGPRSAANIAALCSGGGGGTAKRRKKQEHRCCCQEKDVRRTRRAAPKPWPRHRFTAISSTYLSS
jgi:hypothetical protein